MSSVAMAVNDAKCKEGSSATGASSFWNLLNFVLNESFYVNAQIAYLAWLLHSFVVIL